MSPYDGVKFSKDGSKGKMKRTPIKKKAIDISLLVDCWLCLWRHCRRHVLFSDITDRKDGTRWWIWHGRIREWWQQWESLDYFINFLESTLSRNFVLKRWPLLCHFINCTELEIAKKHGDSWGVLMPHFGHGTWRFDRARSLELLHEQFSMVVSVWVQIMQWPDEHRTRKSHDA